MEEVLVLDTHLPWNGAVLEFNKASEGALIKFVVFPSLDGNFMAQAVPKSKEEPFSRILSFPEHWCGKSRKELSELTRRDDITFCHPAGFLLGAITKETCIEIARSVIMMDSLKQKSTLSFDVEIEEGRKNAENLFEMTKKGA